MPAAYDPYRDIRRQEAERERARKAAERARKAAEAERKAAHQDARKDEAARINSDLAQRVEQLNSFLIAGLPATAEPNLSELSCVCLGATPRPWGSWSRIIGTQMGGFRSAATELLAAKLLEGGPS